MDLLAVPAVNLALTTVSIQSLPRSVMLRVVLTASTLAMLDTWPSQTFQ
jgi:hypothetical protein